MKVGKNDGLTLSHPLTGFLLTYCTTPHSTTGVPPCELLMGRHLRTHWDLLKPNPSQNVQQNKRNSTINMLNFDNSMLDSR